MKNFKNFNLNTLKGREWYHQRFDGCPMFIGFIAEAEPKRDKRKPKGTEADVRISFFDKGKDDWYLDMKDVKRGVRVMLKLARKYPNLSSWLMKQWRNDEKTFEKFFWELPRINLTKFSLAQLTKLWEHYRTLGVNRFTSSAIIDHFALGTDQLIAEMLKKEAVKTNKSLKESDYGRIFAIASAPTRQSFFAEAEIGLLKIILGKSKASFAQHQQKYFWLNNNYIRDQVLTAQDFKKEIKSWKETGKDLKEELVRLKLTPTKNKEAKQNLFQEYKFSRYLKTLLTISDDFTYWQDERKRATYLNIHVGCLILKEIAKRTGYKLDELKYAVASEISGIIQNKRPSRTVLSERMKGCAFVATRKGIVFLTGREVEKLRQVMFGNKKHERVDDFRGLSASTGKAIGKVKVVRSSTEIGKVKQGDILVAVMTRPDYVVAMKKAAAIVTNEGGITSHAAIVSRELGIPCIIGTKIATEVLKDGDLVEVNANHGWVRKIDAR